MTEEFIHDYIPERMKQLGFTKYHIRYRDIGVFGQTTMTIEAYNEIFFIVDVPPNMIVESEYGLYSTMISIDWTENIHQHRGEIVIINGNEMNKRVKFIQVIIVN
jgi:hypothetical protein